MSTGPSRRAFGLARDRRGVTTLEFGLIALPLCLVLFAVVEIGLAVRMRSALQYATAQAARCAAVDSTVCGTTTATAAYATTQTQGVTVSASSFTVTSAACGKQVTASVPLPIVAHKVIPGAVTLSARSCYPF